MGLSETHNEGDSLEEKVKSCAVFFRRAGRSDVGSAGGCGPGAGVLDWIFWAVFGWAGAAEEGTTQEEKCSRAPADVKRGSQLSPLGVGQDGAVEVPDDGVGRPADGDQDEDAGTNEDDPRSDGHLGFGAFILHKVGALASCDAHNDAEDGNDDGDDHEGSGGLEVLGQRQQRVVDLALHLACALRHAVHP